MGSGSSKEKTPKKSSTQTKVDQVSKGKNGNNRNQIVSSIGVNDDSTNKTKSYHPMNNNSKDNSRNVSQKVTQNGDKSRTSGVGAPGRNTKQFESDSESETDDINEVLEATRREHEERVREQNYYNTRQSEQTEYPETYAQRLQREQYKPNLGVIRQKTMYRNPDDWQTEEEGNGNEDGFDVSKFKQANAVKQVQNMQDRDIFSPEEIPVTKTTNRSNDPNNYYNPPTLQKQKSVPKYDTTEEALLAEIEKEYEF